MLKILIAPIMSCLVTTTPTVNQLQNYISCVDLTEKIQVVDQWTPLIEKHFKEEDINKALLIIYCESTGYANAVGKNTNGTEDRGLWQFNDKTWAWLTPKLNIKENRFSPKTSTRVASWLIYNDGWHHWNSSKHCWKDYDKIQD